MSKNTNKQQLQHLLTLMEANADIACGFYKGSKEALLRFWKNAETELNSMGPPTKCNAEWKKVWADQKEYVRQKAAQNLREKKATGGGPNKELKFSSIEEGIYNLVGMKSAVEGVAAQSYGLNSPKTHEDLIETFVDAEFLEDEVQEEPKEVRQNKPQANNITTLPALALPKVPRFQKVAVNKELQKSSYDVLEAELKVQKDLVEAMKTIAGNQKELQQHPKRIYRSLEKLNESNDKHFKKMEILKSDEIKEMRRHNAFMEKQRVREVEYKLEKNRLELELRECN